MRMALASIADDRDFLALDKINIGIEIIIDAHVAGFSFAGGLHGRLKWHGFRF